MSAALLPLGVWSDEGNVATLMRQFFFGAMWFVVVALTIVASQASGVRSGAARRPVSPRHLSVSRFLARSPLRFEPAGKGLRRSYFIARGAGVGVQLQPGGATVRLAPGRGAPSSRIAAYSRSEKTATIRLQWLHPAPASGQGVEPLPARYRDYRGPDPKQWRTTSTWYRRVVYQGIYPGVDLLYYGNQDRLEYDLVLRPGADPRRIGMRLSGASSVVLRKDGALSIRSGEAELLQQPPVIYQQVGARRRRISGGYLLARNGEVRFRVGAYDPRLPLVIDPVLVYATYFGGSHSTQFEQEIATHIAVDAQGAMYLTGSTVDDDFPVKNPVQATKPGITAAFVTKLDSTGQSVVYSTYLGGSGDTRANGIAVDEAGNVYVCGTTSATDFPTLHPIQSRRGTATTLFIAKLDAAGGLVYASYLGGSGGEADGLVAVNGAGSPCFVGTTASPDVPLKSALQGSKHGNTDLLLTRLNPDGSVLFSTYLGGGGDERAGRIVMDGGGNVVVSGTTASTDFPVANAAQPQYGGGNQDGILVRLAADGAVLLSSTFLGGSRNERGEVVALDAAGNVYVAGTTLSTDFRTTPGAYERVLRDVSDGYVAKLSPDAATLVYSSYVGRPQADGDVAVSGIAVDTSGQAWLGGYFRNGFYDLFVQVMNPAGGAVTFSQVTGGRNQDFMTDLATDGGDNFYFYGYTASPDFPLLNPVQGTLRGNTDPFVLKYAAAAPPQAPDLLTATPLFAGSVRLQWRDNSGSEQRFEVERQVGSGSFLSIAAVPANTTTYTDSGLAANTTYTYRVRAGTGTQLSAASLPASALTFPAALLSLAAQVASATEVDLAWSDPNPTPVSARVQRSMDGGLTWTVLGMVAAGTVSYSDRTVTPGTTYQYQVQGVNASGAGVASNTVQAVTPQTAPGIPAGFQITGVTQTSIALAWTGAVGAASYEVERKGADGAFVRIGTPTGTTFSDAGLTADTSYTYHVRAVNSGGVSDFTPELTGITLPDPPPAPASFRIGTVTSSSVQLTWVSPNGKVSGYELERSLDHGSTWGLIATPGALDTVYTDSGLQAASAYRYRLRATNAGGKGDYSTEVEAATLPLPPAAPGSLVATATSRSSIRLTWTAPVGPVSSYHLQRTADGGVTWTDVGPPPGTATEYVDGGLQPDTVYQYRLQAGNAGGTGPYTSPVLARTLPSAPASPTGLTVTGLTADSISLGWNGTPDALTYVVERKSATADFSFLALVSAPVTGYTDTTVHIGVAYSYRVKAVGAGGESDYSSSISATIPAGGKLKPLKLTLNFGTVARGKSVRKTLKLTNKGKGPLVVTVSTPSAPFTLLAGGGMATLAPKRSVTVLLQFTPTLAQASQAVLKITTTDPTASGVGVNLLGRGR